MSEYISVAFDALQTHRKYQSADEFFMSQTCAAFRYTVDPLLDKIQDIAEKYITDLFHIPFYQLWLLKEDIFEEENEILNFTHLLLFLDTTLDYSTNLFDRSVRVSWNSNRFWIEKFFFLCSNFEKLFFFFFWNFCTFLVRSRNTRNKA